MENTFKPRRVVVVGAAGDIGRNIVSLLLAEDAFVHAIDRDEHALRALVEDLGSPSRLRTHAADVTNEAQMATAFAACGDHIDGLVNAAGIENQPTPIEAIDTATFRKVIDINVTGVFLGLKFGLALMQARGGAVVNFSSTAGLKGSSGMSPYVASKHAVIGLTRCAALEAGPSGVRVNAICPGPVEGRMIDAIMGSEPGVPSPTARARMDVIPSRRFGTAQEIAEATSFLLSEKAKYINGACISVDGGISAF